MIPDDYNFPRRSWQTVEQAQMDAVRVIVDNARQQLGMPIILAPYTREDVAFLRFFRIDPS